MIAIAIASEKLHVRRECFEWAVKRRRRAAALSSLVQPCPALLSLVRPHGRLRVGARPNLEYQNYLQLFQFLKEIVWLQFAICNLLPSHAPERSRDHELSV